VTIKEVQHMALISAFGPDVDLENWRGRPRVPKEELARLMRQQEQVREILKKGGLPFECLLEIYMGLREVMLGFEQRYPSDGRLTARVRECDEKLEAMVQAALRKQQGGLRLVESKP
jgi:hypothetical protein